MAEQVPSNELVDALKYLARHYVGLMEHARNRILNFGGTCDPVDVMERGDPHLRIVREIIAKHEAAPALEPAQSPNKIVERMGAANAFASPATANLLLAQGIREIARLEQENSELRQDLSDARNGWESAVAERSALEPPVDAGYGVKALEKLGAIVNGQQVRVTPMEASSLLAYLRELESLRSAPPPSDGYAQADVMEFIGWLSGDIPELHSVEVPRLAMSWTRFLGTRRTLLASLTKESE